MATITLLGGTRDGGTVTTADPPPALLAFVLETKLVTRSSDGLRTNAVIDELYSASGPTLYRFVGIAPDWSIPVGTGTATVIYGITDEAVHVITDEAGVSLLGENGT